MLPISPPKGEVAPASGPEAQASHCHRLDGFRKYLERGWDQAFAHCVLEFQESKKDLIKKAKPLRVTFDDLGLAFTGGKRRPVGERCFEHCGLPIDFSPCGG